MCNLALNIVVAFAMQICAKDAVEQPANKLVGHLLDRMPSAWPLLRTNVDSTTLAKPSDVANLARSHHALYTRPVINSKPYTRYAIPHTPAFRSKLNSMIKPSVQQKDFRPVLVRAEDPQFHGNNNKMVLPSDSFGGASAERKAAMDMKRFFTFVAIKIVLNQLEGVNRNSYYELKNFYETEPLLDADGWMEKLLAQNKLLAVRIMEVRKTAAEDFEWDWMQKITLQEVNAGNEKVMRRWAEKAYGPSLPLIEEQTDMASAGEHADNK